jgi:flagellar biosynthesis/type III secretory pathway protein FliH
MRTREEGYAHAWNAGNAIGYREGEDKVKGFCVGQHIKKAREEGIEKGRKFGYEEGVKVGKRRDF